MPSPQALGAGLNGYNMFLPPDTNAKLRQIQMQQQLGQALQQQGLTPLDLHDRQIGGIGYKVSPLEGLSKIADALMGTYEQKNANDKYAEALSGMGGGSGQITPQLLAAIYPDEAAKAMMGDHRPGASYFTPNGYQTAPTDLQINTGTAGGQQPSQGPPVGGGTGAPTIPVQGPQDIPPMPEEALAQSPQGGVPAPPAPGIQLPGSANVEPAPAAPLPTPTPGESPLHFQARLEVARDVAKAQGEVAPAIEKTRGQETAKNQVEATLNSAQIDSRINNAMKNVDEMMGQVANTSTGIPHMSQETQQDILRRMMPDTAAANTRFEQLNNQIYVQELGPLIKQLGSRGNQFVENAVKQGSAVDIRGNPQEKLQALQGIKEYLGNIQQNAHNQQGLLNGAPTSPRATSSGVTHIWTPTGIVPAGQQ